MSDRGAAAILFVRHCFSVKSRAGIAVIPEVSFKVSLSFSAQ
ncbi:MAG TPA: hypothetical protein VIJ35_02150 [Bradyrhizobium sp.]